MREPGATVTAKRPHAASWGRADRLRSAFLRLVDGAIPPTMRGPDTLQRARIILGFALVLMMLGLEAVFFFSRSLPSHLSQLMGASLAVGLVLCLAVPGVFRRHGSLTVGGNLVIAGCYLVVTSSFTVVGGIQAPTLHWLALLPLLAVLMGARTSAWVWAIVGFLTIGTLSALDAAGYTFPNALELGNLSGNALWTQRLVDVGSWLVILLSVALLYESHSRQQTQQLAHQNERLASEIEQRSLAEERTQYLAYYDELTTLPNRRLFEEHLQAALEQAPRIERVVAVLFLDLDGFKEVNDTHGHDVGDQLLQQVALRLKSCIRVSDVAARARSHAPPPPGDDLGRANDPRVVSRLGGDEFTILLTCIRDHREAGLVAQRVLGCFEAPFALADHEVFISTSIGISLFPTSGETLNDLLRNADLAMYHAKDRGKNTFQFFEDSMNLDIVRHSTLAKDMRKGLDGGDEFSLHFQPIVEGRSQQVVGVEALARWNHPERGPVSPGEFIEVAERSGLIVPLGDWVFHEACRQYAKWDAAGLAPGRIAINVSGPQIRRGLFVETALAALREHDVDPSRVELEVTEGAMLVDEDEASRCLSELKRIGVRVALDDFGTGYSSLSYVKRFPVDSLKVDRSFVSELETDPEAQVIVSAIIAMAHQLGLKVVGEGVETDAQERFLLEHGCDELQGYRYGRPASAGDIARLLLDGAPPSED